MVTLEAAPSREHGLVFTQDLGTVEGILACLFQQSGPSLEAGGYRLQPVPLGLGGFSAVALYLLSPFVMESQRSTLA